jgi:hypothetical protein
MKTRERRQVIKRRRAERKRDTALHEEGEREDKL